MLRYIVSYLICKILQEMGYKPMTKKPVGPPNVPFKSERKK
jgi:hypothetical protein